MPHRVLTTGALILLLLAGGAVGAQQSNVTNAVVIAALQAMGLFGSGYATGQVPAWNATTGRFAAGAGSAIPHIQSSAVTSFFIGTTAGNPATTAIDNVGIGYGALTAVTTGFENVAVGSSALASLTDGNRNVALGVYALLFNVSGDDNIGIGRAAAFNLLGNHNIGIGSDALIGASGATGSQNIGIGALAFGDISTGSNNIGIGFAAGDGVTTGGNNTIIGSNIAALPAALESNIIIASGGTIKLRADLAGNWTANAGLISPKLLASTFNTAAATTYTVGQVMGGIILRDPNGAARADLVPTAANMLIALPNAIVGSAFEFTIRNTADAAETITVTTNTGVTLSGTMTIAQNNTKRFLLIFTNVTAASEAYTLYSLGTTVH